jgi:hypothetical protein
MNMAEESEKKRRGRPPLAEGMMADVTLRLRAQILEDTSERLLPRAGSWPEFAASEPTRAGILKLALSIGLKELEKRVQVTPEED